MKTWWLLLVTVGLVACGMHGDETTATKTDPSTSANERTWWFDIALDEERYDSNHDEERSPAPPKQEGEQVKVAVQLTLNPKEHGGLMKVKYVKNPTDCEAVELLDAGYYDNGDMEVVFRAEGKYGRELRGMFGENSKAAAKAPYHKKFFFTLKIMRVHTDGMVSLFSMNDGDSFTLQPEEVQKEFFDEDDSEICQVVKSEEKS